MIPEFKKATRFDLIINYPLFENNFFQTWMHLQNNGMYNSTCK